MFQEEKGRPSCVDTKHSHPGETMSDSNWQVVQLGMGGRSQKRLEKCQNTGGHKVGQSLWEKDLRTVLRLGCELGFGPPREGAEQVKKARD